MLLFNDADFNYHRRKERKEGDLHVRVQAIALLIQNLDSDDLSGLGNAKVLRNCGSSTVSTVAVFIFVRVSAEGLSP